MTITITDVGEFINQADTETCDRLFDLVRERKRSIGRTAALSVRSGCKVKLHGLSPKYLNGLEGKVTSIRGQRGDVALTSDSVTTLRLYGGRRFFIPHDATEYTVPGVPLSCCEVLDG